MKTGTVKEVLGCLPKAVLQNFILGAAALAIGTLAGGPKIYMDKSTAFIIFFILLVPYLAITYWSIISISKNPDKNSPSRRGPYDYVRHPMYAAIIFILNPALGFLFRSWLLLLSSIPAYFIWKKCVREEEKDLEEKFGQKYYDYLNEAGLFFPNIRKRNKPLYYTLIGVSVFFISFTFLNYAALYVRWVQWQDSAEITYDEPSAPIESPTRQGQLPQNQNRANYNPASDQIFIAKINITAPIIVPSGTTQTELNRALNDGAVLYPGSSLPGQKGEVMITGHSSTYPWNKTPYGKIFSLLDKLEEGDMISLVYSNTQYDYRVTGKQIVGANEVKIYSADESRLTLMTCWPIGTSLKRLVVRAELIQ